MRVGGLPTAIRGAGSAIQLLLSDALPTRSREKAPQKTKWEKAGELKPLKTIQEYLERLFESLPFCRIPQLR
jgi:hypothetical protein